MERRRVKPLHIVEGNRRIDHKSEDPGTDEVPERNGDEKVDHPFVLTEPRSDALAMNILPGFEADHYQRHDLECAEYGAECERHRRRSCEIEVMASADDAAGQ